VASRLHGAALRGKLGRMATPITISPNFGDCRDVSPRPV
jgi:hypothetical protein